MENNVQIAADALSTLAAIAGSYSEKRTTESAKEKQIKIDKAGKEREKRGREQQTAFADKTFNNAEEYDGSNNISIIKKFISAMATCIEYYQFESKRLAYLTVLGKLSPETTS